MILLIDNYDSFSYNLYQLVGSLNPDIRVIRNDEMTISDIGQIKPEAIFLSPGPGKPADAGICTDVVKEFAGEIPILGVCLGHQVIFEAFGGTVDHAASLMHGKEKPIRRKGDSVILDGLPEVFTAARYHSLAGLPETLPSDLRVTAVSDDDLQEIMAVEHVKYPVYGLQFHPESVMTREGRAMIANFLGMKQ